MWFFAVKDCLSMSTTYFLRYMYSCTVREGGAGSILPRQAEAAVHLVTYSKR